MVPRWMKCQILARVFQRKLDFRNSNGDKRHSFLELFYQTDVIRGKPRTVD